MGPEEVNKTVYKITIYDRASYPNDGEVLLDTSSGVNPGLSAATYEGKLNEAGSFNFTITKRHPLYDSIAQMETYVSVEEDGDEIFYGRVIMVKETVMKSAKQVTCEGALAFLLDAELGIDSEDTSYTASNYFSYLIGQYNTEIGNDPARAISVGTVNIDDASDVRKYKNPNYQQIQNVLKTKLVNTYDGFVNIRRSGTTHVIDWVKQVGTTDPQVIEVTTNVNDQVTSESGEDVFTVIRAVGSSHDIVLAPIIIDQDLYDKYGAIIRTVTFGDCDTTAALQTKVAAYVSKLAERVSLTGEIKFVDMKYLDGTSPKVKKGDVFTSIYGYEGTEFIAETVSKDVLNPANDKMTLKTSKDLLSSAQSNGANSGSSSAGGTRRGISGGGSALYKYIHETDKALSLATNTIEIMGKTVKIHGDNIETLSVDMLETQGKWTAFEGTGIYQNKESITEVAGKFRVDGSGTLLLDSGTEFRISTDGTGTNVGRLIGIWDNRVHDLGQLLTMYAGSYSYQHDDEIGAIVGKYYIEHYVDPVTPWRTVTPEAGDNPQELGYYEKVGSDYVLSQDTSVVSGKTYYLPNDRERVIFDSGGGYRIKKDGVEYGVYTTDGDMETTVLDAGIIINKINGSDETQMHIDADHIYIGNQKSTTVINGKCRLSDVTAEYLTATLAEVSRLATTGEIAGATLYGRDIKFSGATPQDDPWSLKNFIKELQVVLIEGTNNYKLQKKSYSDANWVDVDNSTFSRAITSWTGSGWSNGVYTAHAVPQNQEHTTTLQTLEGTGSVTKSGKSVIRTFKVLHGPDDEHLYETGFSRPVSINASDVFDDGYDSARLAKTWGTGSDANKVTISKSTTGSTTPISLYVTTDTSVVWDSTENKFKATPHAYCDGSERSTGTTQYSGEITIVPNSISGSGASGKRTVSVKNGSTVILTSSDITDYGDGYKAGSSAVGLADPTWNAIAGQIGSSRTVSVSTTGRVNSSGTVSNLTKDVALTLSTDGLTVFLNHGSTSVAKATCFDGNLAPGNIRGGVEIFGVTGTYSGTDNLESKTITANGTYLPSTGKTGFSSVVVTVTPTLSGAWSNGTYTVSSSPAASADIVRTLSQGTASWAANKKSVTIPISATYGNSGQYSESTGWSVSLDTSTAYNAGSAAVGLADPTWNAISGSIGASRTVSVSTTGRVNSSGTASNLTKDVALTLSTDGLTVFLNHGSTSVAKATCSDNNLAASNIKSGVSIFGVTGNYTDTVAISPSTAQTLDPGDSVTIYAQKNGTSVASVSVSANTDANLAAGNIKNGITIFGVEGTYDGTELLETKSITANGTYTPSTGKTGFSSVAVTITPNLSGSWSNGALTVSSSPSASDNFVRTLASGSASWATNKKSVTVPINATYGGSGQYSESTGYSVYVDTSSSYNAGSAAVNLSDTLTWGTTPASGISVNQNAVTVSTSGRVNTSGTADELTKTINLYSSGSASGLTATFYVTHTNSTDANRIIKRQVTCSDANLVAGNIKNGVSIFGVTGSYSDTVTISPSTAQTLDPGDSVTVYAKKNGTNAASVSVSANTDANLVAGNIKSGVSIFGVTGSYSGGGVTWPSPQTSYSYATFTANGESRTYTVVAPYTLNNTNYAVLKRGDDVFAALNIQSSYDNIWTQAYIAGWNAYYDVRWYIPTDPEGAGYFMMPGRADSSGAWSYFNWSRATNAYNDAACHHTDKGSNWYCTITTDGSGNKTCRLSRTFGVSQSVPFSNGSSYHLYT